MDIVLVHKSVAIVTALFIFIRRQPHFIQWSLLANSLHLSTVHKYKIFQNCMFIKIFYGQKTKYSKTNVDFKLRTQRT